MQRYSAFPKAPSILEPLCQIVYWGSLSLGVFNSLSRSRNWVGHKKREEDNCDREKTLVIGFQILLERDFIKKGGKSLAKTISSMIKIWMLCSKVVPNPLLEKLLELKLKSDEFWSYISFIVIARSTAMKKNHLSSQESEKYSLNLVSTLPLKSHQNESAPPPPLSSLSLSLSLSLSASVSASHTHSFIPGYICYKWSNLNIEHPLCTCYNF